MQRMMVRLEIHQEHARLAMETEMPLVQIDQRECFSSAGIKSPVEMTRGMAADGYSQALEYIAKVAGDGDSFAAIENGGNPVVAIAKRDSYRIYEYNLDYMPKAGPKFYTKEGKVHISPSQSVYDARAGVSGEYIPGKVIFTTHPGKVEVFLRQEPSIEIRYIENE